MTFHGPRLALASTPMALSWQCYGDTMEGTTFHGSLSWALVGFHELSSSAMGFHGTDGHGTLSHRAEIGTLMGWEWTAMEVSRYLFEAIESSWWCHGFVMTVLWNFMEGHEPSWRFYDYPGDATKIEVSV